MGTPLGQASDEFLDKLVDRGGQIAFELATDHDSFDLAGLGADDLGDEVEVTIHGKRPAEDQNPGADNFADLGGLAGLDHAGQVQLHLGEHILQSLALHERELVVGAQPRGQNVAKLLAEVRITRGLRFEIEDRHRDALDDLLRTCRLVRLRRPQCWSQQ